MRVCTLRWHWPCGKDDGDYVKACTRLLVVERDYEEDLAEFAQHQPSGRPLLKWSP